MITRGPVATNAANLIAQFGADTPPPDLWHEIVKCERRGKLDDACAVHFVGLAGAQNVGLRSNSLSKTLGSGLNG